MSNKTFSRWINHPNTGLDGLQLEENIPIPEPIGRQCLVRIRAVSLNYRDLAMATDRYPLPIQSSFVPCSDAAGQIVAVGPDVTDFQVGDDVCMLFMQAHQDGVITPEIRQSTLGSQRDGVLQEFGIFDESGLVHVPNHLTYTAGSTLPCAAVTAWNCLFGLESKHLQPGEVVLTEGTGGVSLFVIQFALAIGATVISTTSSPEKADKLRSLGVHHVINYRSDPNWGETAKSFTQDGLGAHHIIEVGGEVTIPQALKAIRPEGVVSLVGFLGGKAGDGNARFSLIQQQNCIVRGINVGSKKLFQEMNAFIENRKIQPVISERAFSFREAKAAYEYMDEQNFWGKIVITTE